MYLNLLYILQNKKEMTSVLTARDLNFAKKNRESRNETSHRFSSTTVHLQLKNLY